MTTLYNLRTEKSPLGDNYRITKFVDGNVESSYLLSHAECECPAGARPTCRHRQMLSDLLPYCNTHWFLDFDHGVLVDFLGTPMALVVNPIPAVEGPHAETATTPAIITPTFRRRL